MWETTTEIFLPETKPFHLLQFSATLLIKGWPGFGKSVPLVYCHCSADYLEQLKADAVFLAILPFLKPPQCYSQRSTLQFSVAVAFSNWNFLEFFCHLFFEFATFPFSRKRHYKVKLPWSFSFLVSNQNRLFSFLYEAAINLKQIFIPGCLVYANRQNYA